MPSFGYPRGVSQSARICPETRQREERGQIGRRKRRRITCSCWGQGHASTMIRGVIPQEVELTGEIGGWKPRPRGDYDRGPKPLPGGLGGWKPRPREPGARATAGRTRGLEATAEGTGGPEPRPGGLGGWKPRPRGPGARTTAGRRSRNGGRSHAHANSGEVSVRSRIQNHSLFMEYTCPRKHTHHTPRRVFRGPEATAEGTGGWSHGREGCGPKPQPRAAGQ